MKILLLSCLCLLGCEATDWQDAAKLYSGVPVNQVTAERMYAKAPKIDRTDFMHYVRHCADDHNLNGEQRRMFATSMKIAFINSDLQTVSETDDRLDDATTKIRELQSESDDNAEAYEPVLNAIDCVQTQVTK